MKKIILCIGGSDPSGGGGIQIDIPTTYFHNCFPLTAITSITSQNSEGVYDFFTPEPQTLRMQLEVLNKDYAIDAIKIGMLGSFENVKVLINFIKNTKINIVVLDPVFKSSTGFDLLDPEGQLLVKEELIPLCSLVTPNLDEAETLTNINIKTIDDSRKASALIADLGVDSVLLKGGHLDGKPVDLLNEKGAITELTGKRLNNNLRGTGCMLATSVACNQANGLDLKQSCIDAKDFVYKMIENGAQLGNGSPQVSFFR